MRRSSQGSNDSRSNSKKQTRTVATWGWWTKVRAHSWSTESRRVNHPLFSVIISWAIWRSTCCPCTDGRSGCSCIGCQSMARQWSPSIKMLARMLWPCWFVRTSRGINSERSSSKSGERAPSALELVNRLCSHFTIQINARSGQAQETTRCTSTWTRVAWRWAATLRAGVSRCI